MGGFFGRKKGAKIGIQCDQKGWELSIPTVPESNNNSNVSSKYKFQISRQSREGAADADRPRGHFPSMTPLPNLIGIGLLIVLTVEERPMARPIPRSLD